MIFLFVQICLNETERFILYKHMTLLTVNLNFIFNTQSYIEITDEILATIDLDNMISTNIFLIILLFC